MVVLHVLRETFNIQFNHREGFDDSATSNWVLKLPKLLLNVRSPAFLSYPPGLPGQCRPAALRLQLCTRRNSRGWPRCKARLSHSAASSPLTKTSWLTSIHQFDIQIRIFHLTSVLQLDIRLHIDRATIGTLVFAEDFRSKKRCRGISRVGAGTSFVTSQLYGSKTIEVSVEVVWFAAFAYHYRVLVDMILRHLESWPCFVQQSWCIFMSFRHSALHLLDFSSLESHVSNPEIHTHPFPLPKGTWASHSKCCTE